MGRTAVVTGASRGIGAVIAERLAAQGVRVVLVARTRAAIEELAASLGGDAFPIVADLSDEVEATAAADRISSELRNAPDILVNNAGVFTIESLDAMSVDSFSAAVRTNLVAPFAMIRAFLPAMRARRAGHVVTIGSVADRTIFAGNGAYAATKFGARAMHEVLREETRGSGIGCSLISPAAVNTDIWEPIRFPGSDVSPSREGMMQPAAVADAVIYALTRSPGINIDELRLSRS